MGISTWPSHPKNRKAAGLCQCIEKKLSFTLTHMQQKYEVKIWTGVEPRYQYPMGKDDKMLPEYDTYSILCWCNFVVKQ